MAKVRVSGKSDLKALGGVLKNPYVLASLMTSLSFATKAWLELARGLLVSPNAT
jgi:hypothetical protein